MLITVGYPNGIDYRYFNSPFTALATMIFVQMEKDLETLGDQDILPKYNTVLQKREIISFLRSDWAEFLAGSVGIDRWELERYAKRISQ